MRKPVNRGGGTGKEAVNLDIVFLCFVSAGTAESPVLAGWCMVKIGKGNGNTFATFLTNWLFVEFRLHRLGSVVGSAHDGSGSFGRSDPGRRRLLRAVSRSTAWARMCQRSPLQVSLAMT